jgi:hypothetical protein
LVPVFVFISFGGIARMRVRELKGLKGYLGHNMFAGVGLKRFEDSFGRYAKSDQLFEVAISVSFKLDFNNETSDIEFPEDWGVNIDH